MIVEPGIVARPCAGPSRHFLGSVTFDQGVHRQSWYVLSFMRASERGTVWFRSPLLAERLDLFGSGFERITIRFRGSPCAGAVGMRPRLFDLRLPFSHQRNIHALLRLSRTTVPLPLTESSDSRRQRMARSVYRDRLWVPSASELLQAGVQIGLPETPCLAFNTGQDVALHSSLPGPCQQGSGRYEDGRRLL